MGQCLEFFLTETWFTMHKIFFLGISFSDSQNQKSKDAVEDDIN